MTRLGFIGTGTITEAMVTGFLEAPSPDLEIHLSPRNAAVAARLAARYPGQVAVSPSNQAVLDACDIAVLAVRPQVVREVLAPLAFRPDHHVLSIVATISGDEIATLVAPAERVTRAIPLPSLAHGAGPTVLTPPDPILAALFARAGVAIEVDTDHAYAAMGAASAVMASHFAMADAVATWLAGRGVAPDQARRYVGQILSGLAGTADRAAEIGFAALADEHATRGGLNEQLRAHLADEGAFDAMATGLDALLLRIEAGSRHRDGDGTPSAP